MNIILIILVSLSTILTPAQPITASPAQPFKLPAALTVECLEDQPCWDCATMGNKLCGPITPAPVADAWKAYDAQPIKPSDSSAATRVEYSRTVTGPTYRPAPTEVVVPSPAQPAQKHVFTVTKQPTARPAQPTASPAQPKPTASATQPTASAVNPECAEQSMQTASNGSCLPTACPVIGQVMDSEGNCVVPPLTGLPAPHVFVDQKCPVIHPSQGGNGAWAGSSMSCPPTLKGR